MEWSYTSKEERTKKYNEEFTKRVKKNSKWHRWFAWWPVKISSNKKVWLERVYRSGEFGVTEKQNGRLYVYKRTWRYERNCYDLLKKNPQK